LVQHPDPQIRVQLRLDCPGVAKWVSPRVSAALMSTVLGPTVEFAFIAGNVVTTRSAAVPGAVGLVLMAVLGTLLVDGPHGLLDRTASLSPRPTNRDKRGNDDGPGGSEERPEDRGGHEGRSVTQTTTQSMHQLLFSSPSRGHSGGPADAKIISAHHGKTDHEANPYRFAVLLVDGRAEQSLRKPGELVVAIPGAVPGVGAESMIPSSTGRAPRCVAASSDQAVEDVFC